jgi:hypothetical protein
MPADQRGWLDEDQRMAPIEPAGEPGQDHPSCLRGTTWLDLAFLVEGQVFTQQEGLCRERRTGAQTQAQEAPRIHEEHQQHACEGNEVAEQARASNHGEGIPLRYTLWFPPIIAAGRRDVQSGRIEFLRRTPPGWSPKPSQFICLTSSYRLPMMRSIPDSSRSTARTSPSRSCPSRTVDASADHVFET